MQRIFNKRALSRGSCLLRRCQPICQRHMGSDSGLSLTYEGNMAVIRMEQGDNRLNQNFFNIFHDFLDQIEGNEAIHGLITTGQGKFYSNGLDLDWMGTLSAEDLVEFMNSFAYFVQRILLFPVPTLAAINGHCFAAGAITAFAQDFRVMNADRGWICLNEVHLDKRFFGYLSVVLKAKLGAGLNTSDALVFGRRYTGQEALSHRLIHKEAPASSLLEDAHKLLQSYLGPNGFKRETLGSVKRDIYSDCLEAFNLHAQDIGFSKQFMTDAQLAELGDAKKY